jgi:hypothetical protein
MKPVDPDLLRKEGIIVGEYAGVAPVFEIFYLESIVYAAGRASDAFQRHDEALKTGSSDAVVVATVHEALTHAAALSRFVWPSRVAGMPGARGAKLRAAFSLDEQSPLHDRDLRNALEHYDERLDRFLLQDIAGYLFPGTMVGPADLADEELGHIFQLVDPEAEIFVLLGEKHTFGPLRRAVEGVLEMATRMSGGGGRLPHATRQHQGV